MSDDTQPNRDHRCRTCEHWGAPYLPEKQGDEKWPCVCPIPYFVTGQGESEFDTAADDGEQCQAYLYEYRRARLVKPG